MLVALPGSFPADSEDERPDPGGMRRCGSHAMPGIAPISLVTGKM